MQVIRGSLPPALEEQARQLLHMIDQERRAFEQRVEPLRRQLIAIESLRTVRYLLTPEEAGGFKSIQGEPK